MHIPPSMNSNWSEIESLRHSLPKATSKRLLHLTELTTTTETENRDATPSLPKVKKVNSSFCLVKKQVKSRNLTFSEVDFQDARNSWKNLSRKNSHSINIIPSKHIQDLISNIKEKVEKEFQYERDSVEIYNANSLEMTSNLKDHVYQLRNYMISRKNAYNEIHNEVLEKQQKLRELEKCYNEMQDQIAQGDCIEDLYHVRNEEHYDFTQGLRNELYYQETLKYMLIYRKENIKRFMLPVDSISLKLKNIKNSLANEKSALEKLSADIENINKEIDNLKKDFHKIKKLHKQKIEEELKIYEDYQMAIKCISAEHSRNEAIEKQKNNSLQLIKFEKDIGGIKEFFIFQNEALRLEKLQENQDNKFKAIQRVANISCIQDMMPYYTYLKDQTENLSITASQYEQLIDNLNKEKYELLYELNRYKFEEGFCFSLNSKKIDEIKREFKKRIINIEKDECTLNGLQDLLFSTVNVISRIVFQLSDKSSRFDVNRKNLNRALAYISSKLEMMTNTLKDHKSVYCTESINTATDFMTSPSFLKLNSPSNEIS
ncbi:unnamed protein product [Blepharisma stoltei]|uniref:DUF4200 domain-containing protein n=1 Tax=Blepharisma stoltei TaxID=1481888 RepID=A0AAU9IZ76_9CILI|nr:unnamed protein product [Blepharisma stoltei]